MSESAASIDTTGLSGALLALPRHFELAMVELS